MSTSEGVVRNGIDQTTASGWARDLTGATPSSMTACRAAILEHALRYIDLGWCLVPLGPGTKEPISRRRGAVWSWVHKHRMDASRARSFFALSGCDIGIIMGAPSADLAIVDIEGPFVDGFRARFALPGNTPIASTPSGGLHVYVHDFSGRPTLNLYLDGTRIGELRRAAPSYVVAPPADGRAWMTAPPWTMRIAYLPSWTSELIGKPRHNSKTAKPKQTAGDRPSEHLLPPVTLRVRYAAERLSCGIVPVAVQGKDGHSALLRAAVDTVRGYCVPTGDGVSNHAFDVLWKYFNSICVPPWEPDEDHQIVHKLDEAVHKTDKDWAYLLDYRMAFEVVTGGGGMACGSRRTVELEVRRSDNGHEGAQSGGETGDRTEAQPAGSTLPNGDAPGDERGHPSGRCLIDVSGASGSSGSNTLSVLTVSTAPINASREPMTANSLTALVIGGGQHSTQPQPQPPQCPQLTPSKVASHKTRPSIEQLIAKMPSRLIPTPELLQLLRSDTRGIAEDGPRPSDTPESRAFIVALGCVYGGAGVTSTTDLLLTCKGGVAVQNARDPKLYARELWLDAWRARDREIADAVVMIVDAVVVDANPRGRALSRMTTYLRPFDKVKGPENQIRYDMPVKLGAPHAGELSGEFVEARSAFEAGAAPERGSRASVREAWTGALVLAVLSERDGVRGVRHLLPLDADRRDGIRAAIAVCSAFSIIAETVRTGGPK